MNSPFAPYVQRIQNLQPETPAKWGKMNAHQMICHCTDQVRAALGEKESKDKSNFFTRGLLKVLFLGPLPTPKGKANTAPEFDQRLGGTQPTNFEADREEFLESLKRFEAHRGKWYPHPLFGELNRKQWTRMVTKHLDHHFGQFGV